MKAAPPVQHFNELVLIEDPTSERALTNRFGPAVRSASPSPPDPIELYRRRYWYYVRKARENRHAPSFQRVVSRFQFDVLDDLRLNACAARELETNLVAVNSGTILNLLSFFRVVFSDPKLLMDYGEAPAEKQRELSLFDCDWRRPIGTILTQAEPPLADPPMPVDPLRLVASETLATMALDFVFFHEVTHLRRGHVDFHECVRGVSAIDEAWGVLPLDLGRASQALELEADGGALEIVLAPWFRGGSAQGFQGSHHDQAEVLQLWLISIAFLFALFDPFATRVGDYLRSDHPHPTIRMVHVLIQGRHIAGQQSPQVQQWFEDAWWRAMEVVGEVADRLRLPSALQYSLVHESFLDIHREQQELAGLLAQLVDRYPVLEL